MAKQLNVSLAFTADTSKAKQQLQELQSSLDKLISSANTKTGELGLTKELAQASAEANKLKILLESSTSASGTLDLGKFSQGLKKSGMELKDYANTLQSLGPEGTQAFAKLAQSITTANIPLKQSNKLLQEFATTMKNTVRWQFSSSMLHGFMGAMSGALSYAKDLDKSLNDIRIVTEYNTDRMAQFAAEANKAAKALSTTTTEYTNASLIYFQQGLTDEEVAARSEVTIKMANAAGVSAQKVSDQMTAVWNNFDNGSKSLEYYADVMTALGAATASSTDEISQGLNKFAAVSKTVGLSYEYATAALATVTATTRESADVVGTAFKTLFARIQGLQLGETLDDGTTLNKYSTALAKVGIDIKDGNDQLKQMDTILDEMGAKWQTLSVDQQTALAQTVAGVRQYGQLMALMNNWDYFKQNVKVAEDSTGTLKKQAEIYAESWEASSKRVKAAAQGIYDKLLDEDFFIGVNNVLEESLGFINNLIDGLGGLPGVLSMIASWMLKAFGPDIAASMERIAYNIKLTSKSGQEEIFKTRKDANKQLQNMYDDGSISGSTSSDIYAKQGNLQDVLLKKTIELESKQKNLTEEEQKQAALLLDKTSELGQQIIKIAQIREKEEEITNSLKDQLLLKSQYKKGSSELNNLNEQINKIEQQKKVYATFNPLFNKLRDSAEKIVVGGKTNNITQYRNAVKQLHKSLQDVGIDFKEIKQKSENAIDPTIIDTMEQFFNIAKTGSKDEILQLLEQIEDGLDAIGSDAEKAFSKLKNELLKLDGVDKEGIKKVLQDLEQSFLKTGTLTEEQIQLFKNFGIQIDSSGNIIKNFNGKMYTTADTLVAVANIATNVASVFNSIKGLGDIWSNEDLSFGEKMINTLSTMGMVVGTLISTYDNFNKAKLLGIKTDIAKMAISQGLIKVQAGENALQAIENGQLTTEIVLKTILNALDLKKIAIYALVAAAIAAVVVVAKSLYDAYHKDAQGAKEAADQAKMLADRYKEAKAAAEELKDTISDWSEAHDALADLEEGTQEYADALENANAKAKELIETYKLWDGYETKNGIISFKSGVLEDLQQQEKEKANKAESQMYGAQIYANQAQLRSETTNQSRKSGMFATGTYTTTYNGYAYENYRSLSENETQYIAEVAKNLQDSLGGVTPTAEQLRNELSKLSVDGKLGSDALSSLSTIINDKTVDGFISLGTSMGEVSKANLYYAQQLLENSVESIYGSDITKLASKNGQTDAGRYEQILDIYANKAAELEAKKENNISQQYANVESKVKGVVNTWDLNGFLQNYTSEEIKAVLGKDFDGSIDDDRELGLMYASMLSGQSVDTLTYVDGWDAGTVKDKEGNTIIDNVSDQVMRKEIAKQVAMQKITSEATKSIEGSGANIDSLKEALNNIISGGSKAGEKYGADFSSAILDAIAKQDFKTLDFSNLFAELTPEEMAELSGMDKEGILGMLGVSESDLTTAGYNVDTFVSAFGSALEQWTYQLDTSGIEERAGKIKEFIDDLDSGSVITEEAYNSMQELGIDITSYFTKMADGSYKLTGIAEDLVNLLNGATTEDFINKILEVESATEFAKNTVMSKYNSDSWAAQNFLNEDGSFNTTTVDLDGLGDNSQELAKMRAEFLQEAGGQDVFGFSDEQAALLEKSSWTIEEMQVLASMMEAASNSSSILQGQLLSTATTVEGLNKIVTEMSLNGITLDSQTYANMLFTMSNEAIQAATSLEELHQAMGMFGSNFNQELVDQKLIELGEQYQHCTDEVKTFEKALLSNDQALIDEARSMLEISLELGEMAEKYDLDVEATSNYADRLADGKDVTVKSKRAFQDMAIAAQRLDRGVKNLNDNIDDYRKVLKTANRDSFEFSETMDSLKTDIADMFNVADGNMFSDAFAESLLAEEDFQKVLKGDTAALDRLRASATMNIGDNIIADLGDAADTVHTKLDEAGNEIANSAYTASGAWDYVKSVLADGFTLEEINNVDFVNSLNDMIAASGMTKDQIQSMLGSMGVSAKVKTDYVEQETEVPTYYEYSVNEGYQDFSYTDDDGTHTIQKPKIRKMTVPGKPVKVMGYVPTYSLETASGDTTSGGKIDVFSDAKPKSISSGSTSTGGGGGGGSAKKTSTARTKKSDTVERYKPVNDKLDDMADALDDASKAADRLWGTARIKQMEKVNSILEDEIELIKEKKSEAEAYLKIDRDDLNAAAADLGISFNYQNGNIANYESQMTKLYNEREALLDSFGEEIDDTEQETLDAFDKKLDRLKEAITQYDETRELIEDLENEEQDKRNEIQDNNFEKLNYALEIEVQFNEDDLAMIEYHMSKMEDDFYLMAEAYAKLSESSAVYEDNLQLQKQYVANLEEAYKNGEISQAAYIEGLQNAKDATMENAQALIELDRQMMEYYGNTLDAANEELSKYTDKMEHLTSVLDHYSSIMDLLGKKQDYATMGSILEGQAHTIRNELEVAQRTYEMYDAEAKHWKEQMDSAIEGSDAWEVYKANWEAAQTAANDAQDSMLAKTEEWAEAMKAVVENNMAELNQTLEQSLTGGSDFDTMLETMERASSLQEEYLTTTNKIYETNKLMRTAQQEIDKTQNTVAKRRLTQFIKETEQLQHQNKLSNYELEIQQAKYDLLLAEIALEEAQNAKSTVRLQRDAEGNFGYVYTADQDKVAQAQQELEDAQNSLYNIGLEGANNYSQKYAETMQEMYDTMAELQQAYLDGEIATQEEYDAKMLAAKEYYFNKLKDYSNLYQVALTTDSRVVNDAWSSDFNDMIYKTGELQSSVNTYVSESATILQGWSATVKQALSETGLDNIDEQVKDVTTASDELKESLIGTDGKGGVVKAIQDEITEVNNLSGAYAAVRTTIQGLIADHEKLMSTIDNTQKTEEEAAKNTEANVNNATDNTSTDQQTQDDNSGNEESAAAQHDERTKAGVALAIIRNATAAGWGNGSTRKKNLEAKGFSYNEIQGLVNTYFGNSQALIAANGINWPSDYSKYVMSRFNTGGYTGSWGPYGKLGILDEKELVLNQGDTANFLASMEVLERILQVIDLHSMNAQLGGLLSSPAYGRNNNETTIEQSVHIEASFPGVTDRNELQEAFNNLVNQASQYANRK